MTDPTTPPDRHPGGRPTKLTQEFLAAAYEVINHEQNALIYTDEELLFLINEKLSPEAKICMSTFQKWKAGKVEGDTEGHEFLRLITKALLRQKETLFKRFQDDGGRGAVAAHRLYHRAEVHRVEPQEAHRHRQDRGRGRGTGRRTARDRGQ